MEKEHLQQEKAGDKGDGIFLAPHGQEKKQQAENKVRCDLSLCLCLTRTNIVIDGNNKKHGGHGGHALDDIGNGLGLDRIDGPEDGCEQGNEKIAFLPVTLFQNRCLEKKENGQEEKNGRTVMNKDIDDMIADGIVLADIPVQGQGEAGNRPVQFPLLKRSGEKGVPECLRHQVVYM